MIKLIIVEDEPLMNDYIVSSIEWNKFGIILCGVFYNGKSALDFLQENEVDIVITDIKMPVMDGLTFIESALAVHSDIKFIVLSSYDDFNIVKSAFKYGITDYILKNDFDTEMFQKLLINIIPKVKKRTNGTALSYELREIELKQYFWGYGAGKKLSNMRINTDESLDVAIIKLLNYNSVLKNDWDIERELMKYGLVNCIDEILESYEGSEFFFSNYDEIVFLFSKEKCELEKTKMLFDKLFEIFNENFGLITSAGLCNEKDNLALKKQYQLANTAQEYGFLLGRNKLILYSIVKEYTEDLDINILRSKAEKGIRNYDFDSVLEILQKIDGCKLSSEKIEELVDFYHSIVNELIFLANANDIEAEEIKKLLVMVESKDRLNEIISSTVTNITAHFSYHDIAITKIQEYIRKNYSKNLTLQVLAKEFNYDYSDLSRRFLKATGTTYSKFVTEVRLNAAMELARSTDFKLSEISQMVGYNNYETFSRAFKTKFDKWPNQVRRGN